MDPRKDQAHGQGLEDRGKDLGRILGSLGPINRDLEKLNSAVAERDFDRLGLG